jgi:SAM-dependent methyltransferase
MSCGDGPATTRDGRGGACALRRRARQVVTDAAEQEETMSTTVSAPQPDLVAVKRRQQQTWASGDYAAVAARIVVMAEHLVDAADLRAGERVLDVATGSGNAALAAARSGCEVTGIDYVPELLERGRARAAAEGLAVTFAEGDAEDLPFPDASFDAVLSCVGVMFTPDQERAAAELLRVCRPGGTIALANWTPTSFVGQLFRTVTRHVPPPARVRPPGLWGTEERLRELLGTALSKLEIKQHTFVFRFRSPEEFAQFFRDNYGPVRKAFEALDDPGCQRLYADLVSLAEENDRAPGASVAMASEYLQAIAIRK